MNLEYLFGADFRCCDNHGNALTSGFLRVYVEGSTSEEAVTYKDFGGGKNPSKIPIPSDGMPIIIVDTDKAYRVHCYDDAGVQIWSRYNVKASAHVPSTMPFAVDEDHLKLTRLGNSVVLSLADSLVAALKAKGVDIE